MSKHLTDKERKQVIADFVVLGTYAAVSRKHKISPHTVRNIVAADPHITEKCRRKKEQNTADILAYMDGQKETVCNIIGLLLQALQDPEKLNRASIQSVAVSLGIIIDKFTSAGATAEEQRLRIAVLKEKTGQGERDLSQFEEIVKANGGRFLLS